MNSSGQSSTPQRCPYLGLHDDPGTSLAYPSAWNYCFRAHPPASVNILHQTTACLSREYIHCPVYLAENEGPLPPKLRGSSKSSARGARSAGRSRLAWSVVFIIVLIPAVFFGRRFLPGYFESGLSPSATPTSAQVLLATGTVQVDPTKPVVMLPSLPASEPASPTPVPPVTGTRVPSSIASPTRSVPLATLIFTKIPGICGYSLDTPFGADVKFVLHQVVSGENLDVYARQNQTTMDAIRAVNYFLPLPVWENWIVVIPVNVSDVTGIPSFEPYQADGTFTTLDELAQELGTDAESLGKFNAFDDSCTRFMGWLIVPRDVTTP